LGQIARPQQKAFFLHRQNHIAVTKGFICFLSYSFLFPQRFGIFGKTLAKVVVDFEIGFQMSCIPSQRSIQNGFCNFVLFQNGI